MGMAIVNLVIRPLSCIAIHQVWRERAAGDNAGNDAGPSSRSNGYDGIEGNSYGTAPPL